jgi:hypothetical protein
LIPILPSNDLTMFSEITRPSPIPWVFICLVLFRHPKSLKSLILSFFLIPIPESITEITILSLSGSGKNISTTLCSFSNLEASELWDSSEEFPS